MPYVFVAVCAWVLAGVFYQSSLDMAPAAYQMPRILAVLVSALAVLMLIDVFLFRRRHQGTEAAAQSTAPFLGGFFDGVNILRAGSFLAAIILYVALLEPVGYFIMTPLFLVATFMFLRACRPWIAGTIAVVAPVFVYLVFVFFLDLPVPMGVMG